MPPDVQTCLFHGLECLRLATSDGASAVVSRFGAHVLSWTTADGDERLFLSERAAFDGATPIRGGIPVCFPQFSDLGPLAKHGLVRTRAWTVAQPENTRDPDEVGDRGDGAAHVTLVSCHDASTLAAWPHRFEARLRVLLSAQRLEVTLRIENTGVHAFSFTGALHTYLRIDDLAGASLSGLHSLEYRDAAGGNILRTEQPPLLRVAGEVDRVYHAAAAPLTLRDGPRTLVVGMEGFADVVVWNPGAARCAALPDMAPDGFQRMLCIEAAAARLPVQVAPGTAWSGGQSLTVSRGTP